MDSRLLERNLRSGKLTPAEYEMYLKKLPDDESQAEFIECMEDDAQTAQGERLTFTSG